MTENDSDRPSLNFQILPITLPGEKYTWRVEISTNMAWANPGHALQEGHAAAQAVLDAFDSNAKEAEGKKLVKATAADIAQVNKAGSGK